MRSTVYRKCLVVVGLCAPLIFGIYGCSGASVRDLAAPQLESLAPRIASIDFGGVNLEFDARIRNTLPVAILTPKFRYALAVEGRNLANGLHPVELNLPASGVGVATLPVRISYADVFAIATALKSQGEAAYRLSGALIIPTRGRAFELPLAVEGRMPLLKPPSLSDFKLGRPEVSMSGAKFTINARILNPNVFPLGISGMGYDVRIGELSLGGLTASTESTVAAGTSAPLRLDGEVSLMSAAFQLLTGARLGKVSIAPAGMIETPWGEAAFSGRMGGL